MSFLLFLVCLYESMGSYFCHPDNSVGMDVDITLKSFNDKVFFM